MNERELRDYYLDRIEIIVRVFVARARKAEAEVRRLRRKLKEERR